MVTAFQGDWYEKRGFEALIVQTSSKKRACEDWALKEYEEHHKASRANFIDEGQRKSFLSLNDNCGFTSKVNLMSLT